MGIVAKSAITLVSVNDAYTLSLAPHSCIIKADFDGQHPQLGVAESVISVLCGDERMPISIAPTEVTSSHPEIKYTLSKTNDYQYRLCLTSIPVGITEGQLAFAVRLGNGTVMEGKFSFTVVRESTMLDWIQDWENNKTKLAGSYIITPKLFVGNKISGNYDSINKVPGLTGVYIGPTSDGSAGLFGYKDSREIFRLDKNGGKIGGWEIVSGGIRNSEGSLLLDASGSISSQTAGKIHWFLRKDGSASFANGNVTMDASGNAAFKGRLTSKSGEIGGWSIGEDSLSNIGTALHATKHFIAIANVTTKQTSGNQLDWVRTFGGVALHYTSDKDYGLIAYNGNSKILSVGAINQIAGWNLDNSAIWIGTKNNNIGQYTEAPGSITLGTNGLRGNSWYINIDGSVSFAHGAVQFNDRIGKIAGWHFDTDAIYTGTKKNVAFTFTDAPGHITIGSNGIRGHKWRLNSDGSGVLAGGNIRWNYDGSVEFSTQVSEIWETTITRTSKQIRDDFTAETQRLNQDISTTNQNLANLTIGGRNLLINTQFTKRDSYQTVRGTYRIELDSVERYQGSNSLKLTNTKAGKIYEDVLVSGEQPAAGEYITVSLYVKAATVGTILSVRVCDNGEVQQTATLTTAWQRISFTFHALKAPSRAIGIWYDRADTVWVALPQMEVGNKVTDWSPAPEDVASDAVAKANQALADAKEYANGIQQDLTNSLNTARTELKKHAADLDAALLSNAKTYADGQVTESEKRMIEDNRTKLQAEQEEATRRLNEAIAEALSTAKGYVKDVQVGGRNYFGQHKGVATAPAGALSPDNNGVVFRNRDRLNCRIEKLNLPGVGWYAVSMFIRATKACTIASINLCDAVSKDKTLENVSVTTSFRYITGVFHAERYINDDRWNGFLDFESSIDPSIEVTVRDLMITPGNQPMSWVPAPEDLYADIAAKAKAAQDAAKEYTEAQDLYYQGLQNSYADGQITESEKRMIKDAEEKLKAAKQDAQNKADAALAAANTHTNTIKNTLDGAISAAKTAAQNVQTNLDNLTIGGRNLLRYSGLEKTPLNNIVYGRKPENVPVGVEEGYQGAKAVKLVFTTPGKPSVSEVMWRTWEERTDHSRVEPVVLRFWAKADKDNTRMWTVLGYHGGKIAYPTISSEWKEYTVNFMPDGPWALWCIGLDAPGTVWISRPKLEYGTKPTDWTPAPEDVDNSIDGIRTTANQASADAGDAKQKAGEAVTNAQNAATSAGKAESSAKNAETKAGEAAGSAKDAKTQATNAAGSAKNAETSANAAKEAAKTAKADADAAAQSANASKEAADAAKTRLDSWAADNVISPMEKQGLRDETARIDADKSQVAAGYAKYGLGSYQSFTDAYNAYRAVLVTLSAKQPETISIPADFATKQRNYYTQRSTALTRIADAAKEYVDGLQIGGRNLLRYSALDCPHITDALQLRGGHTAIIDKSQSYRGAPSAKIVALPGQSGSVDFGWRTWIEVQNGHKVAPLVMTFAAKASVSGVSMCCRLGWIGEVMSVIQLTTEWKEYTLKLNPTRDWIVFIAWMNRACTVWISRPKLEYGTKPTDWTPAPEDITSEIAAKTEAARQAAQSEAIGLNKWIAQAYYTGENKAATPPKLEDIAGKTPTRTVELKDAQFNLSGNGSVFNMDYYTGIRTTYVYLEADYNLTTGIQHDDAGSLYVNGALVASGPIQTASWKSVTLPLKKGWNRIDGLWNEGGGGDFFKFQAPLENDAHIIQLACRPNVSIDPMRAVTMTTLTEKYSEIAKTNEKIESRVGETEKSIQEVDNKVKGFTTVDKNGQVLIKPESVWAGVETKVAQLSDESLAKLSVGGRNLILNSDTSAAPVAMKTPTDGAAYKIFPVKTTLVKHDCQEEEPYTLTVWYTSTSQFPFESFPIGGKPGGDDWSVRFIASEGQITQEGGMKKCVMQAVVPKGGRVLYNPTVGFIYGANSPCNMSLHRVKLERGQKSTDWTPAPEDLPTIDTLSKTGIDIQQGVITLDAQKVKIQNGSQTMAMFEGGKLKADLIDASRIDAGKLNAGQIFSGTIDARNATFNNLTVSQGSKLGGWKVQGSDLVSDAATNASIRIEHRGKFLTSDESNPIEINNSAGNTLLIDGSRSSVQAEVTLTGKINNIRALAELSPAGLYTNLAAQEYKYGSLGAVVANVMYMPSSRSFRIAGVVGRIHDSAPNRNASYKKGFNGVFGENLRADGLMLGARDLTGDGTVYSIENLMTDTVLLIRGRPIIDLSNTPAELKGKFFFIFTHTGTRVRFKKDGRITQDNNAWNIFLLFNGSTWEVRSWDCDYREF